MIMRICPKCGRQHCSANESRNWPCEKCGTILDVGINKYLNGGNFNNENQGTDQAEKERKFHRSD